MSTSAKRSSSSRVNIVFSFSVFLFIHLLLLSQRVSGGRAEVRRAAAKDAWDSPESVEMDGSDHARRPLKVTFKEPARNWTDALPIGNGRLGAMVWGGVSSEILNLNGVVAVEGVTPPSSVTSCSYAPSTYIPVLPLSIVAVTKHSSNLELQSHNPGVKYSSSTTKDSLLRIDDKFSVEESKRRQISRFPTQ